MNTLEHVQALGAPQQIEEAAKRIDGYLTAKLAPPRDLISYLRSWVGRNQQQNRYGQ